MVDVGVVSKGEIGIYYHREFRTIAHPNWSRLGMQIALDLRPLSWDTWFLAALIQVTNSVQLQSWAFETGCGTKLLSSPTFSFS